MSKLPHREYTFKDAFDRSEMHLYIVIGIWETSDLEGNEFFHINYGHDIHEILDRFNHIFGFSARAVQVFRVDIEYSIEVLGDGRESDCSNGLS